MTYPEFLPQTEGWYLVPELEFLYDVARALPEEMGPILEVGCYRGLSTSALARAGPVVVVDSFRGVPGPTYSPVGTPMVETGDALRAIFWANMRRLGLDDRIDLIAGDSRDALPLLVTGRFRVVHLDSDHTSPAVERDLRECWRLLAPGGILVVDDVDQHDVGAAVEYLARETGRELERYDRKVGFIRKGRRP